MAGISAYHEKQLLDFGLGGAGAVAQPASGSHGVGLSLGAPTSISASEIATGSGWTRQPIGFAAAASPAGSASNNTAATFGPGLTAATFSGLQIWDDTRSGTGNMLWYGNLATPRTLGVGDSLVIASGALTITLA
jgi:hypothetical protein